MYTRTSRVPGVNGYRDQEVKSGSVASRVINTSRTNSAIGEVVCVYSIMLTVLL